MFSQRLISYTAIVAFIIYSIAAYNCEGYYHPDEHYQIIEFAGLKNGTNNPSELAWEYIAQIRPSLQPYICLIIFHQLKIFHITDSYQCAFIFRLITAIIAILVIAKFIQAHMPQDSRMKQLIFCLLSYFMWFMPYLNTRFSSEIWSGLSFLLGIGMIGNIRNIKKDYFYAGLCMGFAFIFRYQTAFMILGMVAWLTIVKRISLMSLISLTGGGALILLLSAILDYSFYGNITFPYINYFEINILKDVASEFGTAPWYYYLEYIYQSMTPPLGIIVLVASIILLIKKRLSPFIWIIIPFFLIHCIIPHKEGRFLFPLVYFIPIILLQAYEVIESKMSKIPIYIHLFIWSPFVLINILVLSIIIFKPAANGRKYISSYIHQKYGSKCVTLYYTNRSNPYDTWELSENFYKEKCLITKKTIIPRQLSQPSGRQVDLLIMRQSEAQTSVMNMDLVPDWQVETTSIPVWIQYFQTFYHGQDLEEPLILYRRKT